MAASVEAEGAKGPDAAAPKCYLIVHNVSKKHNIGTLVRSAVAFGVHQMCLVGSKKFNTFGNHGSADYMELKHFEGLRDCREYLVGECGCTIFGVEIIEGARPIQNHPFTGNAAFILGNEGSGLNKNQMAICDAFVYIPQHGRGTASLNVTVAGSIVLHHFALWAQFRETEREGYKFVLGERPQRTCKRGEVGGDNPEQVRRERELKKAAREGEASDLWLDDGSSGGVLGSILGEDDP